MSETAHCPHCGSPMPAMGPAADGLDPLYQELRRIREIAESRQAAESAETTDDLGRVAALSREVAELRATVARLRGAGPAT
ncbi:MAG TPA: hypothetical protein VG123_37715 [Streptosporangiaceae bacterium]|nr:hypothetical protein [Streptosporangiaceae bacterium]